MGSSEFNPYFRKNFALGMVRKKFRKEKSIPAKHFLFQSYLGIFNSNLKIIEEVYFKISIGFEIFANFNDIGFIEERNVSIVRNQKIFVRKNFL